MRANSNIRPHANKLPIHIGRVLVEEGLRRVLNDAQAFENIRGHFSVIFLSHQRVARRLLSKAKRVISW